CRPRNAGTNQPRPHRHDRQRHQGPGGRPAQTRRGREAYGGDDHRSPPRPDRGEGLSASPAMRRLGRLIAVSALLLAGCSARGRLAGRSPVIPLLLAGCSARGPEFKTVSGSENQVLEPIVQDFCKEKRATCTIAYLGSLDIGLLLRPENQPDFDAVWPASGIWIDMFDTKRRVTHLQSVAQTPVILGVRKKKAEELGWTTRPVSMADILSAVETKGFKFLMTSATQSNSGASAYLSMLAAALGKQGVLQSADLGDEKTRDQVARLLAGVER